MPGPLERAEEVRDGVIRIVFALGLLFLFLMGLIEATAFVQIMVGPRFSANVIDAALGTIGASSLLISTWTLLRVRTLPLWRLIVQSAVSAVFATVGFAMIMGAH